MDMSVDPTLRFFPEPAARLPNSNLSDGEFLRTQVAAIEAYVESFPSNERELRALAWIEANASRYRQQWQIKVANSGNHGPSAMGR